jgi:hypothetical protein
MRNTIRKLKLRCTEYIFMRMTFSFRVLLDFSLVYYVLMLLIYGFIRHSLIVVAENTSVRGSEDITIVYLFLGISFIGNYLWFLTNI